MSIKPTADLARARARLEALAAGEVAWPTEGGVGIGPSGHHWWPCFPGTDLALIWIFDEDGVLMGARDLMLAYKKRHPGLTWAAIRAGRAYVERHLALFQAQGWLDAMGNDDFPYDDEDECLRADVAAVLAALTDRELDVAQLTAMLVGAGAA